MRQWRHAIREMIRRDASKLDAELARRCFNSVMLTRDFGVLLRPTGGSFSDKHWCEVYRMWLYKAAPLVRGHHPETDACIDVVLARVPRELHVLILRHVYYKFT
jgi:hypothetical protein